MPDDGLKDKIQELLWQAAELQAKSYVSRLEMDQKDEVPTDAATLNAITATLKLHGVHLGAMETDEDPIAKQRAALSRIDELKNKLKNRQAVPAPLSEDDIMRILQ